MPADWFFFMREVLKMKLDKLIKEIDKKRKAIGWTFVDIAKIGECSPSTISQWLNFECEPAQQSGLIALHKICNKFKINYSDFCDLKTLDGRLTYLAFEKKLNLKNLSVLSGNANSFVSEVIAGKRQINSDGRSLKKLADYCGVTPEWILHGDKKEPLRNGLIDLPIVEEKTESVIFTAKPKAKTGNFIKLDNGMIADISTGRTFTIEQFNDLFEV